MVSEEEEQDNAFIARVLSGCDARLGEDWVRGCFMDYTQVRPPSGSTWSLLDPG